MEPADERVRRQRLGRRLRDARRRTGLTQAEAAGRTAMSASALSEIERGRRRLDALALARLARLCRVDPGWLATGEPPTTELPPDIAKLVRLAAGLPEAERRELARMAEWLRWRRRRENENGPA